MFNWFRRKKKVNKYAVVVEAKLKLLEFLHKHNHSKLIPVFEQSIITTRDPIVYSMVEVHIGSLIALVEIELENVDIEIRSKFNPWSRVIAWCYYGKSVIYLNTKYVSNSSNTAGTLMHEILHLLGYTHPRKVTSRTRKHLPYTLGSYVKDEINNL